MKRVGKDFIENPSLSRQAMAYVTRHPIKMLVGLTATAIGASCGPAGLALTAAAGAGVGGYKASKEVLITGLMSTGALVLTSAILISAYPSSDKDVLACNQFTIAQKIPLEQIGRGEIDKDSLSASWTTSEFDNLFDWKHRDTHEKVSWNAHVVQRLDSARAIIAVSSNGRPEERKLLLPENDALLHKTKPISLPAIDAAEIDDTHPTPEQMTDPRDDNSGIDALGFSRADVLTYPPLHQVTPQPPKM